MCVCFFSLEEFVSVLIGDLLESLLYYVIGVVSISETFLYVSSFEHALRNLVSSPLIRLEKMPFG